ncbi:IclR family transcriptional regulator [Nocardia aurantia]|uniref:Pectin degradation repressor protein KdgR n=1 Tax=Nocardia aurantia TaxID=2585199 RepID=A0A7K0DV32_9NOCA|nr:IclR family transcriptional regulator [Nocardia aurantia]MQY29448.1 Pectin degradation repressor protein KdgR [Nocardia aurantia]
MVKNGSPQAGHGTARPKYPVGSVDSALRLLLLVSSRPEIRLSDAGRELGIGRSTAHRLMQMLEFYGFAAQDPRTRAYRPGPALANAGLQLVSSVDLRETARPHLEMLASGVRETVYLQSLRRDGLVICLDSVEGPRSLRVGARTGETMPAHATAGGRVLLAALPDATVEKLLPNSVLPGFTEHTITDRDALLRELTEVRKRGYGVSVGELESDIGGVGVAIRDPMGRTHLAVAVAVPCTRLTDADEPVIATAAGECADRISAALGA